MLKFFTSRFRHLTQPFRITTPFKPHAFTATFSQLHDPGDSSKLASLLSGLELNEEEEERNEELRSSVPKSFHGQENTALSDGDTEESGELGLGVLASSCEEDAFQISHPWPEWVDLMELLLKRGYFDAIGNPFGNGEADSGAKEPNLVRTACLNFGRDRIDLIRHLSRKEIQSIVGFGCPSLDRKVINSGKRLRAYVGIDEGNTCSSCSLRGNCDRAYVKAREEEVARTVDVMRILLTFGLDHTTGSVENVQCQNESVKESARGLLGDVVGFSQEELDSSVSRGGDIGGQKHGHIKVPIKQGDWICPKCNFMNFARNIKCLRCNELSEDRVRKMIEDQNQLPLKKGDWLCEKCSFLNFAKNSKCKLCQEKPPKRKLDHGEWECDSCRYINFRKNTICLRCDYRRPKAPTASNPLPEHSDNQDGPRPDSEDERRQTNSWKFVVDKDNKDKISSNKKRVLEFVDFPILGGRSALSQNEEEREKWRARMRERNNCMTNRREKDNGSGFAMGRPVFLECTDDRDMEEWFGQAKD